MKKTILTIAILTASAFANAEYMIQIPLEASGGGALPNGSIQIVKNEVNPTNPVPEPVEPETPAEPAPALTGEQACAARENDARSFVANNVVNGVFEYVEFHDIPNDTSPTCRIRFTAPKALYSSFCAGVEDDNNARSIALMNAAKAANFSYVVGYTGVCK
ncbi:hypothetical protein [Stutzerimonas zhaodongensis]|jgi:hypothetical protein|uniref:hypothetical protein n=1 Tax=Stutzerimonas zhaodongensis TaxID=1176257 RepID=UPI001F4ED5FA|nr:hypothetical protein [Stutzerimonas zhaodongensis]UNG17536.1 hypothetical protein MKP10_17195 [Stutzerimonas zhaodongensis]